MMHTSSLRLLALASVLIGGSGCRHDDTVATGPGVVDGGDQGCALYESSCSGACVATASDPHNCGACGVSCNGGQVCNAGHCGGSCDSGYTACGASCADVTTDSANCGSCGNACGAGTGCVQGSCAVSVGNGMTPASCAGGGPAIGVPLPSGSVCAGNLAQTTFTWALCSCGDVSVEQGLTTDAYNSTQGAYTPGGHGGAVGLDGRYDCQGTTDVGGTLWSSEAQGIATQGTVAVHQELHDGGPFVTAASATVAGNGYVDGNVEAAAATSFGGTLYAPASAMIEGPITYGALAQQPVTVPPPCACDASQILPIANIVSAAAASNDDASIGLDANALSTLTAPTRLDLPCGQFYLSSIGSSSSLTIVAHGHTALYVGGDVELQGELDVTLDPDATFDVFVTGSVGSQGDMHLGALAYPALFHLYIGGTNMLALQGGLRFAGGLYAANAAAELGGGAEIYGALFVGSFAAMDAAALHYDNALTDVGTTTCGSPPATCTTCGDCGNQACVGGKCGACQTSADCCAPLLCNMGTCSLPIQ
jgi:hypothetical protein